MDPPHHPGEEAVRQRGRRVGIAIFAAIVSVVTGVWSVQIILQVWFAPPGRAVPCREGLAGLIAALERARDAASVPAEERERVRRFRSALQPEWAVDVSLDASCRGDAELSHALDEIRALRYEEEQAVRNPAAELAAKRRHVRTVTERVRGLRAPTVDD